MARRRRTLSSLCCFASLPTNPIGFHFKFFVLWEKSQFRRTCLYGKLPGEASLFGGPDPFSVHSRRFLRALLLLPSFISPTRLDVCRSADLDVGSSSSLHRELCPLPFSMFDDVFASVNRRRRRLSSSSLGLGQISTIQSRWKCINWAWPIFGPSRVCCGLLSYLGYKLVLLCKQVFLVFPRLTLCHRFTISDFFTHRFTGYFSGFLLPTPDTSPVGPVCFWFRTTFVGLDSAQIRRRLITGYFSGVLLPASMADPGCSQPRTTVVGSRLNGYSVWCFVTSFLKANFRIDLVALVADSILHNIALYVFCVVQGVISFLRHNVIKVQGRCDDVYCLGVMIALIYPSICFSLYCFCIWFREFDCVGSSLCNSSLL
ncbi:unnamed protein product [Arabidopsis lyrata]|nr:unnamed protein product [Arabidopsis lyrata]